MKRNFIFAILLLLSSANASAALITWSPTSTNTSNAGNFDTATMLFSGVTANSFSWDGSGYFHSHSTSTTVTSSFSVLLDGTWTQVATATTNDVFQVASNTLSNVYDSVSFAVGTVTGIRFASAPQQNQSYHSVAGQFELSSVAVPEPGTLLLLSLGLGVIGFGARRRHNI